MSKKCMPLLREASSEGNAPKTGVGFATLKKNRRGIFEEPLQMQLVFFAGKSTINGRLSAEIIYKWWDVPLPRNWLREGRSSQVSFQRGIAARVASH